MGKKASEPSDDPHKGTQVNFRVYDLRLLEAIDEYGKQVRHKRNMTILILLEEALKAHGLWPPEETLSAE